MRVRIDEDMKVCPNGQLLELKAGEEHDGPLALWLAGDAGCQVTVLDEPAQDDETTEPPADDEPGSADEPAADVADEAEAADEAEQDGSLAADLTAASTVKPAPKTPAKNDAKAK